MSILQMEDYNKQMRTFFAQRTNKLKLTLDKAKQQTPMKTDELIKISKNASISCKLNTNSEDKLKRKISKQNSQMKSRVRLNAPLQRIQISKSQQFKNGGHRVLSSIKLNKQVNVKIMTDKSIHLSQQQKSQNLIQTIIRLSQQRQYQAVIVQIIAILKQQSFIDRHHTNYYSIKKQNLINLLDYIISIVSAKGHSKIQKIHGDYSEMNYLKESINKIIAIKIINQLQQYQNIAKIQKGNINYNYKADFYHRESCQENNLLMNTIRDKEYLNNQNQKLKQENQKIREEIHKNQKLILHQNDQKNKLANKIYHQKQKLTQINLSIDCQKKQLLIAKQSSQKLRNYIQEQTNNKIIKMAGEQYKRVEEDIYQYAVYLQSNQLATSLTFQPRPFSQIQTLIKHQMKAILLTISQNATVSIENKITMIKDFLNSSMDKFQKKDFQIKKLCDFKTKCIQTFVRNMQKWLDNWTLKQEYLANLRSVFACDSRKLRRTIQILNIQNYCQQCSKLIGGSLNEVELLCNKIEENYKLGNSFY